ncbi:phosphoenolpyruvate carboxylase kinase 2-like protein [Leptotrombidium deliense]|uniref:Serine/threonine-protein kinase greatwall n=1 Tax=Leptotrombidium deliense TaxID=299467 RepID=A0A443S7I9_9ACAR|nr:phosphoenolpyruvate carboxylase kinase 2-like protein [Leptotrombidium deliense]
MKEIFETLKEEISTTKRNTPQKDVNYSSSYYYVKNSVPFNFFVQTQSVNEEKFPAKFWTAKHVEVIGFVRDHEMFGSCLFFQHLKSQEIVLGKEANRSDIEMKERNSVREKKYWSKVCKHKKFYPLFAHINIANSISLKTLISSKALQESDATKICAQICLGVGYLHENGIIHRTLRPEVISIDWRGLVRIADLSTCESKGGNTPLPEGTPFPYVPPEILLGDNYGKQVS